MTLLETFAASLKKKCTYVTNSFSSTYFLVRVMLTLCLLCAKILSGETLATHCDGQIPHHIASSYIYIGLLFCPPLPCFSFRHATNTHTHYDLHPGLQEVYYDSRPTRLYPSNVWLCSQRLDSVVQVTATVSVDS